MQLASGLICNMTAAGLMLSGATAWNAALATEKRTVAVFDFELIDTSLEGEVNGVQLRTPSGAAHSLRNRFLTRYLRPRDQDSSVLLRISALMVRRRFPDAASRT